MSSPRGSVAEIQLQPVLAPSSVHTKRPHRASFPLESGVSRLVNTRASMEEQSSSHGIELAPVDRGKDAWIFTLCSFLTEMIVVGLPGSFGVFQVYYLSHPPFDTSSEVAVNSIGTIAMALSYFTVSPSVSFCQRRPRVLRPLMWVALCLVSLSLLLSGFATSVWQLIILQGIIFGISSGLLYTQVMVYLSEWFVERRAFASSIIFSGAYVGGIMFPFTINALLSTIGFAWSMRALSLLVFFIGFLGNMGIKARVPLPPVTNTGPRPPPLRNHVDHQVFRSPLYLAVALTIMTQAMGYYPVPFYISSYASAIGLSTTDGTLALAAFNLATMLGQVCGGTLCERLGYPALMLGSAIFSATAVYAIWGFAHTSGIVYFFSVVFGAVSGAFNSSYASACADIAGRGNGQLASVVLASLGLWKGIAIVVGPIVSAALHHESGHSCDAKYAGCGFTGVMMFVGSMLSATGIGVVVSMFLRVGQYGL